MKVFESQHITSFLTKIVSCAICVQHVFRPISKIFLLALVGNTQCSKLLAGES